ncbi:hypothetical protein MAR_025957 [Mya arenaria]|uniref:Uncharacterized protein n=1 Tax=Mya arenaria TaxID=6604 RepID=A0ABY7ERL3_MYAAR|nr:hypothetical protein MAR_025957 [Mya arenaria]
MKPDCPAVYQAFSTLYRPTTYPKQSSGSSSTVRVRTIISVTLLRGKRAWQLVSPNDPDWIACINVTTEGQVASCQGTENVWVSVSR